MSSRNLILGGVTLFWALFSLWRINIEFGRAQLLPSGIFQAMGSNLYLHSMSNDLAHSFGPEGTRTQNGFLSWRFRFGKWLILPSLGFWGVNVVRLTTVECHVSIPFSWTTKNPFRSTYFAALAGAAELATGALVKCYLDDHRPYSMLVTESKMFFYKKAKGNVIFKCDQGHQVAQAIENAQSSAEGQAFTLISRGYMDELLVAELHVQWSIKLK